MISQDAITWIGPSRIPEQELTLLHTILDIIEYSDCCFTISLCKKPDELIAHITPSDGAFKQDIVNNLLFINKNLGVKIHFSSSLKLSKIISFNISFSEQEHLSLRKQ